MGFDKRNKLTQKEQIDNVVNSIDRLQLAAANNVIDMNKETQDLAPECFVESRGTNLTLNEPFIKHDAEPQLLVENTRFSKAVMPTQIEKD